MITTTRIIIIAILLNIFISTGMTMYNSDLSTINFDSYNTFAEDIPTETMSVMGDDALTASARTDGAEQYESSGGDLVRMSIFLLKIGRNCLKFSIISTNQASDMLEYIIIVTLNLFKAMLNLIVIIEILMLIKNKSR